MPSPTGPPAPALLRLARQLESQGKRLEGKAVRAIVAQYKTLSLVDLIALLNGATQPLYAAGRVRNLDMLMSAFNQATLSLARPPEKVASLLGNAVNLGSTTGVRMLAAAAQNPDIIEAFRLRPDREIELAQGAAKRLMVYWGKENTRLASEVESALLEGLERGQSVPQLAAKLRERVGVSRSRALLIATNELSNAAAAGQEATQRDAGVTEYEWLSAGDSRVRPDHKERNGKIFKWDDPPPDGHPGQAIRCRCSALAVIPEGFNL